MLKSSNNIVSAGSSLLLEVVDLHLKFGGIWALRGVSFSVSKGDLLSIIGPNGAGKTSLLNVISGFYKPNKGKVFFKGRDITKLPPFKRAELGISRTFQRVELYRDMTVLDNVISGLIPKVKYLKKRFSTVKTALWTKEVREEEVNARYLAEKVLDYLDISQFRHRIVKTLPYGIQKKVELARALVMDPEILLLDEPMGGLNFEEKEDMARYIVSINEELGKTIVLIEHDLAAVMDLSERVIVMDYGRIIAEGTPEEVANDPKVIAAYMGEKTGSTR